MLLGRVKFPRQGMNMAFNLFWTFSSAIFGLTFLRDHHCHPRPKKMVRKNCELIDLNKTPEEQNSELLDLNKTPEEQQDSLWMNMEEFLSNMFLAVDVDEGTSSNDHPEQCPFNIPKLLRTKTFDEVFSEMINYCDSNDQGQTKNPPSPKAFEDITLENYLARAGVFTDDVQEPPPQQTRYKKGIKERRRPRVVKKESSLLNLGRISRNTRKS